ncbi:sterol carrier protein domain-containing protein [Streptomyces sp. NBC_00212]|uniref:sterol carrier protein domain-containing protein n=1 Tax=Streptomyces sp. NBC_00212 TaxID=2975684 RepID=UPI0032476D8D
MDSYIGTVSSRSWPSSCSARLRASASASTPASQCPGTEEPSDAHRRVAGAPADAQGFLERRACPRGLREHAHGHHAEDPAALYVVRGSGTIRLRPADQARPFLEKVHDAARQQAVGWVDRAEKYWNARRYDAEHVRDGATALRFALHTEPDGQVTGCALYRSRGNTAHIVELAATDLRAYASLRYYFINLDARDDLTYEGAPDEVLPHLLHNPRAARTTLVDNLWVRLADVERALAVRRYAAPLDVVLEVEDAFCLWNTGRYRLQSAGDTVKCERTRSRPDMRLSATELAASYLGGPTLSALAAAGRIEELRPGAVTSASRAFRGEREPFHVSGAAFPAF